MTSLNKKIYFKSDGSFFPIITWVCGIIGLVIIDPDDLQTLMITSLFWTVIVYFFQVLKFPKILLTNESLSIIYHPYFLSKKNIYNLNDIENIELYYNYRKLRYHTTEIYVSEKNKVKLHTLGLANESALELYDSLISLGINVKIIDSLK